MNNFPSLVTDLISDKEEKGIVPIVCYPDLS